MLDGSSFSLLKGHANLSSFCYLSHCSNPDKIDALVFNVHAVIRKRPAKIAYL